MARCCDHGSFLLFMLAYALVALIAIQMTSTLPVYLRDVHGVSEQGFGALMSLNAGMVVLFQFPIARKIKKIPTNGNDDLGWPVIRPRRASLWRRIWLCVVSGRHVHIHYRRNDGRASKPGIGRRFRAGGNAWPLHGCFQPQLGHIICYRPLAGWSRH